MQHPVDPATVARWLSLDVSWPGAMEVTERSWGLIAQNGEFDAWLIAWPRGGIVDLHDHGDSRGALHVISGSLVETTPSRMGGRVAFARRELHAGVTLTFGVGHVHDVRNEAPAHALSLHVYSPPLTAMTHYDQIEDRLRAREVELVSPNRSGSFTERTHQHLVAP